MTKVAKAWNILVNIDGVVLQEWQKAENVLEYFNVSKLGEDLAREVILEIVLRTFFPNFETTQRIVSRAEGFASELFPEIKKNEIHMADLERWEQEHKKV